MQEEKKEANQSSENNKRIAKNTMMLYIRQLLTLFVSLYTVREVLSVLGVEDYGLFNVIGGVVAMFSFLSGSMASATQRFFSFALGENDIPKLKKVFSVNIVIYIGIAFLAFILLETIGTWFIDNRLNVTFGRMDAVRVLFKYTVLTFILTIFTSPFMAIIIAHEDMKLYAYISIVEAFLKLLVVYFLIYLPADKLEVYGLLLFAVGVVNVLLYMIICLFKYEECQFRRVFWDKIIFKEVIGFTGWTLFGQLTSVIRSQAITILLNQMFSPVVVAARAVAASISNRINMFSISFNVGLYPPIIKTYAADEKDEMYKLVFNGSKITFFLMWVFALPFLFEMEAILGLWLKEVPEYAVLFTRLALIEALITSVSLPVATAARAPGKMKYYELILGLMQLVLFGIAWLVLRLGAPAYSVYIVAIIVNLLMFVVRLIIVNKLTGLSILSYIKQVVFPVLSVAALSTVLLCSIYVSLPKGLIYTLINVVLGVVISSISMYFIGLDKVWRLKVNQVVLSRAGRVMNVFKKDN
jgi:O-antigen/teichoic acid export membrane protein